MIKLTGCTQNLSAYKTIFLIFDFWKTNKMMPFCSVYACNVQITRSGSALNSLVSCALTSASTPLTATGALAEMASASSQTDELADRSVRIYIISSCFGTPFVIGVVARRQCDQVLAPP